MNLIENMKKNVCCFILFFVLFSVFTLGCSNTEDKSSTKVIETYLTAIKNKQPDKSFELLDPNYLPDKEIFTKSIMVDSIDSYEILKVLVESLGLIVPFSFLELLYKLSCFVQ